MDKQVSDKRPDGRKPVFMQCKACDHDWIGLYTPMDLSVAASIMAALHCPKCGNGSNWIYFKAELTGGSK